MLARRQSLFHPLSGEIDLPLLIPAFSSKGFIFRKSKSNHNYSEIAYAVAEFTRYPVQSFLISAYDLYFRHFLAPDLQSKKIISHFPNTRIIFLDSGGYELSSDFDSAETKAFNYKPRDGFSKNEYENVLAELDFKKYPCVITNYDNEIKGKPIDTQIVLARDIFNKYPDCLSDFIIKPWTKTGRIIDPSKLSASDFGNLKGFNIIGVTEKDLGVNILDRCKSIAQLRKGLDNVGINAPIHIWGGLDPVTTPLYFFAGAQLFDGVSWLRYAYKNGIAINKTCYSILRAEHGIETPHKTNEYLASFENLRFLVNLSSALQSWVDLEGDDFDMFDPAIRASLELAYKTLKTKIKGL